ncbi:MAG: glycosyltransferase family 4 protein [Desulfobaccales bacterium]
MILYHYFGPYHLARLRALTQLGKSQGMTVAGLEFGSRQIFYAWSATPGDYGEKYTLFPQKAAEEVSNHQLVPALWSALQRLNPEALAICGHNSIGMLFPLMWAWMRRRGRILLMDSKYDDFPRHPAREWVKRRVFSLYHGALVSGALSRDYARRLGLAPQRIFIGSDVVNNHYFAREAEKARKQASQRRRKLGLPENYFLCVSRFDEKKNLSRLLQAYARYRHAAGERAWALVVVGSGPEETRLQEEVRQLGLSHVYFPGFKQIHELPAYYGLSRCLITPSSHSEQWGLVVNEAMAAGLPVLVSQACGCAPDLVQEGVNGYLFNPFDVGAMARVMHTMSSDSLNLQVMGEQSRRIIAEFSPETFARNLLRALEMARG